MLNHIKCDNTKWFHLVVSKISNWLLSRQRVQSYSLGNKLNDWMNKIKMIFYGMREHFDSMNHMDPLSHVSAKTSLGNIKCSITSGTLAAAVLLRETPLPEAVGQRQQQEEDPAHDEDAPRTADTWHRPGELVVKRNLVVTGQESQNWLVENHQREKQQDTCETRTSSRS